MFGNRKDNTENTLKKGEEKTNHILLHSCDNIVNNFTGIVKSTNQISQYQALCLTKPQNLSSWTTFSNNSKELELTLRPTNFNFTQRLLCVSYINY